MYSEGGNRPVGDVVRHNANDRASKQPLAQGALQMLMSSAAKGDRCPLPDSFWDPCQSITSPFHSF